MTAGVYLSVNKMTWKLMKTFLMENGPRNRWLHFGVVPNCGGTLTLGVMVNKVVFGYPILLYWSLSFYSTYSSTGVSPLLGGGSMLSGCSVFFFWLELSFPAWQRTSRCWYRLWVLLSGHSNLPQHNISVPWLLLHPVRIRVWHIKRVWLFLLPSSWKVIAKYMRLFWSFVLRNWKRSWKYNAQ